MTPIDLDSVLTGEFEADAREGYAALLASLRVATHPEADPRPESALDPVAAARRLRDCWAEARLLIAAPDRPGGWFPLAAPTAGRLLDTLLTLAAYSGTPAEEVATAGRLLHRLSAAAAPTAVPTDATVFCPG